MNRTGLNALNIEFLLLKNCTEYTNKTYLDYAVE